MQKNKISSDVNYDNFFKSDLKGFEYDNPSVALKLERKYTFIEALITIDPLLSRPPPPSLISFCVENWYHSLFWIK